MQCGGGTQSSFEFAGRTRNSLYPPITDVRCETPLRHQLSHSLHTYVSSDATLFIAVSRSSRSEAPETMPETKQELRTRELKGPYAEMKAVKGDSNTMVDKASGTARHRSKMCGVKRKIDTAASAHSSTELAAAVDSLTAALRSSRVARCACQACQRPHTLPRARCEALWLSPLAAPTSVSSAFSSLA